MRLLPRLAALALVACGQLAGALPARAQVSDISRGLPQGSDGPSFAVGGFYERPISAMDLRELELESRYRATVRAIPDRKATNDPWKTVRPATAPMLDRHRPQ